MAISPKVSIRKIGKSIASLGRRRVVRVSQKDYHSDNHDCHSRDGLSDSETLDSSIIMEDACSVRVDDGPNQSMFPSRLGGVIMKDSVSSCFEGCTSPRMSSRKVLSPEDEATVSPWSSPSLRRRPLLTKMDSWLFLSSARGCTGGPGDDDNDNNDNNQSNRSEEITSEHGDDDVVPPMMMPVKRAVTKSGSPIDRRMAMQREDSWLSMRVGGVDDSPPCVQPSRRTTRHHRGHDEMVNFRRSIAPPVTSTNT